MTLQNTAEQRRSIRDFAENTVIARESVEEILRFAQLAPTWKNSQTGRYYVVMEPEMTAKVKAETLPGFNQNSSKNAPVLIVTTFVKNVSGHSDGAADNECGNEWGAYDLGLQNALLTLKAVEMGYDTLIMGIRDGDAIREILSVPVEEEVVAVIALGKRKEDVPARPRKDLTEIAKFF